MLSIVALHACDIVCYDAAAMRQIKNKGVAYRPSLKKSQFVENFLLTTRKKSSIVTVVRGK